MVIKRVVLFAAFLMLAGAGRVHAGPGMVQPRSSGAPGWVVPFAPVSFTMATHLQNLMSSELGKSVIDQTPALNFLGQISPACEAHRSLVGTLGLPPDLEGRLALALRSQDPKAEAAILSEITAAFQNQKSDLLITEAVRAHAESVIAAVKEEKLGPVELAAAAAELAPFASQSALSEKIRAVAEMAVAARSAQTMEAAKKIAEQLGATREDSALQTADPERAELRKTNLSGEGFALKPRRRKAARRDLESPIYRDLLKPWDLARMLTPHAPLRVGSVKDRSAFSKPTVSVLNMPIKMPGTDFRIPAELEQFREFLQKIIDHEASLNPRLGEFYAYLTVDHSWVKAGKFHRRPGIHIDGVQGSRYKVKLPPENTYSASDAVGTVFYVQPFDLRHLDIERDYIHDELERQADEKNAVAVADYGIYHWDSYSVHRAALADKDTPRTFVRVEFSKKVYDSLGDTVSPLFDYQWTRTARPIPYKLNYKAVPLAKVNHVAGQDAKHVTISFDKDTSPEERQALLKRLGLRPWKKIKEGARELQMRATVRNPDRLVPAIRALSKEKSVVGITVSKAVAKLWDLIRE